jgi:AcrR family transcriptional regulator
MRLFGELGYSATSVARIEAAAGLSPGSGSLYKHFNSKEKLLSEGLDRLLSSGGTLDAAVSAPEGTDVTEQLTAVARAGLRRMDTDRDLSRLLFRGLESFPVLLQRFRDGEIVRLHRATTSLLEQLAGDGAVETDWAAVAVALQGATAHYWLLADVFGEHPAGVDEERFVAAVATLAAALIDSRKARSKGVL